MSAPPAINATALDPARSVVVEACAGSGKTWLLVSRIVRLLLAGARPGEIVAITFTRKAAQEMAARLREWLLQLATGSDDEVRNLLVERSLAADACEALLPRARALYESLLTADPGITITTFHSWFMHLLRRAPLESRALGAASLI
jgi:ATP-dependent helicase/nuclease subunit A